MRHPSLVHRGKSIIGSKDGRVIVVHCPLEIKEFLLEAEPEIYFQTDHYRGYPAILIRPEKIDKKQLRTRILVGWEMNATRAQLAAWQSRGAASPRVRAENSGGARRRPTSGRDNKGAGSAE